MWFYPSIGKWKFIPLYSFLKIFFCGARVTDKRSFDSQGGLLRKRVPTRRNTEIGVFSQWNSENLFIYILNFMKQILKVWFLRIVSPFKVVNFVKICQNIAIFKPNFHRKNLSPPTKINLESWKLAWMYLLMCFKN